MLIAVFSIYDVAQKGGGPDEAWAVIKSRGLRNWSLARPSNRPTYWPRHRDGSNSGWQLQFFQWQPGARAFGANVRQYRLQTCGRTKSKIGSAAYKSLSNRASPNPIQVAATRYQGRANSFNCTIDFLNETNAQQFAADTNVVHHGQVKISFRDAGKPHYPHGDAGLAWFTDSEYPPQKQIIRLALARANVDDFFSDDLAYNTGVIKTDGIGKKIAQTATEFLSWTGTVISQPYASAETLIQNNLAQIMQAIMLLVLYLMLPFVALLSGLNMKVMATYCMLIFSVLSWQTWWTIVMWIDSQLVISMYPDTGFQLFSEDLGSKRLLLDRVTNGAAQFGPMLWSAILSFAGYQSASAFANFASRAQSAAGNAANAAIRRQVDKRIDKWV